MKIKLFYIHPTNYGNLMMACAFVNYFNEYVNLNYGEKAEFYLDVLDDNELYRVQKSICDNIKVFREDLFNRKRRGVLGKIEKLINIPREIKHNVKEYDACIVLGGDCVSQYYSKQVFISDMIKFCFISKRVPFYLLGQTMGPFTGYAINIVEKALCNTTIFLRDHDCYEYIKNKFSFKNIYEARDLAFLDIPYQKDEEVKKNILNKYVGNKKYITVVPSGANRQYTSSEEQYLLEYIKIIKFILEESKYDILLLAHVIHVSDSNDQKIIKKIVERLGDEYKERIHVVDQLIYPYEARMLLGNGAFTITGRMHAAVSSINMGVLPICLSYSVKFKGVIGDDFDLNEYILQCRGDSYWNNGIVSEKVIKMIKSLLKDDIEKKRTIIQKLSDVQLKAIKQIEYVAKEIYK